MIPNVSNFMSLISVVYGVIAIRLIFEIYKKRESLFDDRITPDDQRMANGIAFYLLIPICVALHELGHYVVAVAYHATDLEYHFYFYWGEITYDPTLTMRQDWWIALAGNIVTYSLGIIPMLAARVNGLRTIWRLILWNLSFYQFLQVLLWYPALCIFGGFQGDFTVIYGRAYWWLGTDCALAVQLLSIVWYGWMTTIDSGKRWVATWVLGLIPTERGTPRVDDQRLDSPLLSAHRAAEAKKSEESRIAKGGRGEDNE